MKYFVHWKLFSEFSKLSKLNTFNLLGHYTNTDASFLVYKVRPERTGFKMYSENMRPQLTFLALVPKYLKCLFRVYLAMNNVFKIFTYFLGIKLTSQYTLSVLFLTPFTEFALCCSLCKKKIFVLQSQPKERRKR